MGFLRRGAKEDRKPPRAGPDFDLADWAAERGLDYRAGAPQFGHLSVTCPWSVDVVFNVVRGHWPGGTFGVLCHEARIVTVGGEDRPAHGEPFAGAGLKGLGLDLVGLPSGPGGFWAFHYTVVGTRVPHLGPLTGLHVARAAERFTENDWGMAHWPRHDLADLGHPDWVASVRKHSDENAVQDLLTGPIAALLDEPQGPGFEIRVEYGQVSIRELEYLRDAELDVLVAKTEALAQVVRNACVPGPGETHDLGRQLPAPAWLDSVRAHPGEPHTFQPIGALLDRVVTVADERGMGVEDPRTFQRTFPGLNFPGEPFGVMHGTLPGTNLTGRLLCCAERPMRIPEDLDRVLTDPGGGVGCDVAVMAVDPDAPATAPEGESHDGVRVVVDGGVLTAWRGRPSWQADGDSLDRLAAAVAGSEFAPLARSG
jgi:hypothetical protein